MGMYEEFETDPVLEKKGIVIEYDEYRITVARAGGANKKYQRVLQVMIKPHKRAIDSDSMDPEKQAHVLQEVYITSVILNWEVFRDGNWVVGIDPPKGEDRNGVSPFNKENMMRAFKDVPELFLDLKDKTDKALLFRVVIDELESEN